MSLLETIGLPPVRLTIRNLYRFGALAIQLCAIIVILRQFQIESRAFREVAVIAFVGFAVHYFLPQKHRLPFFALLSITTIFTILGLANGAWLIGFGFLLLGICHLPAPPWVRLCRLLGLGGLAAAAKLEWVPGPWSQAVWPI